MNSSSAEIYLIVVYMTIVLIFAFTAVYIFIRQYKREMSAKAEAKKKKAEESAANNN